MSRENPFPELYYYRPAAAAASRGTIDADVVIYGATCAGVTAAMQVARMGRRAVIADFGRHIGGLTASGLGATDIGNKAAIGGISRDFYRAVGSHYGKDEQWTFEPSLAASIYRQWLAEAGVDVHHDCHLAKVQHGHGRIRAIEMEDGTVFRGTMFLDCTYEGDLMAMAGVSFHAGREPNSQYRETLNGIHFGHPNHNFKAWVDPYVKEGVPSSGLLPGVQDVEPGVQGRGDDCIQAYNFRICFTNVPDNRIPVPKPAGYEPASFELLRRYIEAGVWDAFNLTKAMPNGKTDTNNFGAVSTDFIGQNYAWPTADYATRERLFQAHVTYNVGLFYFLQNEPGVPKAIREQMSQWGLPKDEFVATGGWPHWLYVREGRRMVSDLVMTEHHCRRFEVVEDPIGMAAYQMDSHNCRRLVIDGRVINEGNVEVAPAAPYPIGYRAIRPRESECENLLVPVALSSSHIAFGSIRMEPVFMILGQSAATAAVHAIEQNASVQQIDGDRLKQRLLDDGQVLEVPANGNNR